MGRECHCENLREALKKYLSAQINNVETLVSSRQYLQSAVGQHESFVRRFETQISGQFDIGENLVQKIIDFQIKHMTLWLAGIAELEQVAITKTSNSSPNWLAYDRAFTALLSNLRFSATDVRRIVSEVNTAKTKIWISVREPQIDPAFLMLAASNLEFELKRITYAVKTIDAEGSVPDLRDSTVLEVRKAFPRFQEVERSPFLEILAPLEVRLGSRDEFLKSRANLGLQIRHVYSHGNGRLDAKAVMRLTEPFDEALRVGMKIPFGVAEYDFGSEFFLDVFAALISTLYVDLLESVKHHVECNQLAATLTEYELPELESSLPKTGKVFRDLNN